MSIEKKFRVKEEHSARSVGSGEVKVLSTPALIAFMESASRDLVQPYLEEGQTTVGIRVDVRHLNPVPVGQEVSGKSKLIAIDGNRLTFNVEACWKGNRVGQGFMKDT